MKHAPVYYGDYLQLGKILDAQDLKSKEHGKEAHDETLFIIIHQTYELWFKQIIHELNSVYELFNTERVKPNVFGKVNHRLNRIIEIQRVLNDQLNIIETMTPLDFLEFRDYLVPASGFQSIQFRMLEIKLGLRQKYRLSVDAKFFNSRLHEDDKKILIDLENQTTFLELVDNWLSRMPFGTMLEYDFWKEYRASVDKMLTADEKIINDNTTLAGPQKMMELANLKATRENFSILFDKEQYDELYDQGIFRITREAKLAAVFIRLFNDEPILQAPNRLLEQLLDVDEMFTTWRYRHSIMAHRMLGSKIGTGGSSGHDYLKRSAENNRVFIDFFNIATFLIPKDITPTLPGALKEKLGFIYEK